MSKLSKKYPAYYITTLFGYIGRTFKGKYQIGYRFSESFPTMYINFNKKPKFYNAVLFNLSLFLPYILFLIGKVLWLSTIALIYLILMPFLLYVENGKVEYLAGVVWELVAVGLGVYLMIN